PRASRSRAAATSRGGWRDCTTGALRSKSAAEGSIRLAASKSSWQTLTGQTWCRVSEWVLVLGFFDLELWAIGALLLVVRNRRPKLKTRKPKNQLGTGC